MRSLLKHVCPVRSSEEAMPIAPSMANAEKQHQALGRLHPDERPLKLSDAGLGRIQPPAHSANCVREGYDASNSNGRIQEEAIVPVKASVLRASSLRRRVTLPPMPAILEEQDHVRAPRSASVHASPRCQHILPDCFDTRRMGSKKVIERCRGDVEES
eukprot:TRINITY_DN61520_c0_g1_i1.p1 TRINITY_DN61520_c0_g1~~TRINITY_DN61520_c0_g1_i1.p1  ORF type:complete len:158 (+),score=14.69 TRINITY_DN61520_c0_g1_i1:80-553(+)